MFSIGAGIKMADADAFSGQTLIPKSRHFEKLYTPGQLRG